ncbi:MAG TPA: NUDIX hydrolase [Polyangia bacterium]
MDWGFRVAYRCAYQMLRLYWRLARPHTHGALVTIWCEERVLLVQNSYLPCWSLPGGSVRARESARQAAVRELREEIGLAINEEVLVPVLDVVHEWEGKFDHVEIFALALTSPPVVSVDNREVVEARFFAPAEALQLPLFPPLRTAISQRAGLAAPLP